MTCGRPRAELFDVAKRFYFLNLLSSKLHVLNDALVSGHWREKRIADHTLTVPPELKLNAGGGRKEVAQHDTTHAFVHVLRANTTHQPFFVSYPYLSTCE